MAREFFRGKDRAPQLAGQLNLSGPAAYPLPPMPEKVEGGLAWLERLAAVLGCRIRDLTGQSIFASHAHIRRAARP